MRKLDPASPFRLSAAVLAAAADIGAPVVPGADFPVRLVAYSGDALDDWGSRVVLDLATMSNRASIPLDWEHDWSDNIGRLDGFDTAGGNGPLTCTGAIIPTGTPGDKGMDVAVKMRGRVPYQASVEVRQADVEDVAVNEKVTVNGRTFDGPITVFRNWTLDAVAVCKWGKDPNTAALAATKKHPKPGSTPEGVPMSEKNPTGAAASAAPILKASYEAGNAVKIGDKMGVVIEAVTDPVYSVDVGGVRSIVMEKDLAAYVPPESNAATGTVTASATQPGTIALGDRGEFKKFSEAFGEKAGGYFADGLTFEQASAKFTASVLEENKSLKAKLDAAQADRGGEQPLKASANGGENPPAKPAGLVRIAAKPAK